MHSSTASRAVHALALLTAVNITSECFRYLLSYLSAVSVAECKSVCEDSSFTPLCRAVGSDECASCRRLHDAARFSVLDGACITRAQYGILAGPGFSLLYAVVGIFAGRLADTYNRRVVHTAAVVCWSCATLGLGASTAFWQVLLARLLLGVAESFQAPCSSSLLAQLFPPSTTIAASRARANATYSMGVYVGGGAASLSILLAQRIGWRQAFYVYGTVGLAVALVFGCTVHEAGSRGHHNGSPRRSDVAPSWQRPPPRRSMWAGLRLLLFGDDRALLLLLLLGSSLRFYGGLSLAAFLPVYMGRAFPEQAGRYALANAAIVSLAGSASAMTGGLLADWGARRDPRAVALVPALGSVLAVGPLVAMLVLSPHDLAASLAWLSLEYVLAEGWLGPALALLQASVPCPGLQGLAVAVLLLCCTVGGELGPLLLGLQDPGDATGLGRLLCYNVAAAYLLSAMAFLALARRMRPWPGCEQQEGDEEGLTAGLLVQREGHGGGTKREEDEGEEEGPLRQQAE